MDGCPLTPVGIVVVGAGYLLPHCEYMLSLWFNGYFQGDGVVPMSRRLLVSFPPSYPFEFHGLEDWVILLLGICHSFLGLSPVQLVTCYLTFAKHTTTPSMTLIYCK
jgi:hypothetical protein